MSAPAVSSLMSEAGALIQHSVLNPVGGSLSCVVCLPLCLTWLPGHSQAHPECSATRLAAAAHRTAVAVRIGALVRAVSILELGGTAPPCRCGRAGAPARLQGMAACSVRQPAGRSWFSPLRAACQAWQH